MAIPRIKLAFPLLEWCLLTFATAVYGPTLAIAQIPDRLVELRLSAGSVSDRLRSPDQTPEDPKLPRTSETVSDAGCSVHEFSHDTWREASHFGQGLKAVPRGVIRPGNLKWELPILAATGILIAEVDKPADNRIQSLSFQQTAGRWSNAGLGVEIGAGALAYVEGCHKHNSYLRDTGFKALAAMGAAGTVDLALKLAFDRQFPSKTGGGKFWGGGRSFPSGHSATSFAFAAVIAHRYPHNPWVKWGAYALATGVSLSRYPAKKHFPSDILIGATLGYVTGTYLAEH
jgi:PAP2 superfamily